MPISITQRIALLTQVGDVITNRFKATEDLWTSRANAKFVYYGMDLRGVSIVARWNDGDDAWTGIVNGKTIQGETDLDTLQLTMAAAKTAMDEITTEAQTGSSLLTETV